MSENKGREPEITAEMIKAGVYELYGMDIEAGPEEFEQRAKDVFEAMWRARPLPQRANPQPTQ